jgi:hypothetical protein
MSGGGGFDPGKELAQLDKDLSLSEHAPLIASAAATFMGVPVDPATMGLVLGAGRAIDKGSISEGINYGLQGYAGASLGAAGASAFATPTPTGGYDSAIGLDAMSGGEGAAVPVTTATPVPVPGAAPGAVPMGGPDLVANAGASTAAPMSGGASLADMYGGPAAAPTAPGLPGLFDQATTAYGKLNPVAKYGIPLAAAAMLADRNKGGVPEQKPYDGPLSQLRYDPNRYQPLEVKPPTPYTPVYKDYRNMAGGGLADLGDYADYAGGGRMLKGPGDGMSDSIPATIAGKQPARLANDEFVVSADVVSGLGNGSSDAGAKQLYKMMDRVRAARTGKQAQAKQINPNKYMPA